MSQDRANCFLQFINGVLQFKNAHLVLELKLSFICSKPMRYILKVRLLWFQADLVKPPALLLGFRHIIHQMKAYNFLYHLGLSFYFI